MPLKKPMKKTNPQPITKANTSVHNKTGSWRTHKPVTDHNICIGCSTCAKVCPEACIEMQNGKPKTDYSYCKGCGVCAHECPVKAITMKKDY